MATQAVDNYDDPSIDGRDVDYHWYRQNPDGTWSHKRGLSPVAQNDLIAKQDNNTSLKIPMSISLLGNEAKDLSEFDISSINETLTLGTAIDLLGAPHGDETSAMYPLVYSWKINNKKRLYIRFETEDREEFIKKFNRGEYILPEEVVQYGEEGIPFATDNEIKVLTGWLRSYKASESYVLENGEKHFIFSRTS